MRSVIAALGLFTVIPVPPLAHVDRRTAAAAIAALPLVGGALGLTAGGLGALVGWRTSSFLAGVVVVTVIAAVTGAMHLDGVADTADGLGSRRDPDEALAVMKKSDIGPMGVCVLVLVLLLGVGALAAMPWRWLVVAGMLGPLAGRLGVLWATLRGIPCGRPGGFGSLFSEVTSPATALMVTAAAVGLAAGGGLWAGGPGAMVIALGSLAAAQFVMVCWRRHLLRRLGGLTGDTFGSLIEVGQLACWLTITVGVG